MKKPTKKDYLSSVCHFGGHMKELPRPLISLFPNKYRKRGVTLKETTYRIISSGVHDYANFYFEKNGYWDGKSWVESWDYKNDQEDEKIQHPPEFESKIRGRAVKMAMEWFKENFDQSKFKLEKELLDY